MVSGFPTRLLQLIGPRLHAMRTRLSRWAKPATGALIPGVVADLARSKPELVAENALLRQQLVVLRRTVKRPACTRLDRVLLVLLASRLRGWKQALLIVRPATLLRWHRQGFRLLWRCKSRAAPAKPKLPAETAALIKELATSNRLWGAERIQGELRKLGLRVSKRTIQKHLRHARPPRPSGPTWATFLRHHVRETWACDFLQVTDLLFRPLFAFFVVELASRRVVHVGVTRHPTDAWAAQQLREATPFGAVPRYLIHDRDSKYGPRFAGVAAASGITVLRTPYRAPRANAICERFLGSVRRECLDHLLLLGEHHLRRALGEYVAYFNQARPHQGIGQAIPEGATPLEQQAQGGGRVIAIPVLGGLHHDYRRVG